MMTIQGWSQDGREEKGGAGGLQNATHMSLS